MATPESPRPSLSRGKRLRYLWLVPAGLLGACLAFLGLAAYRTGPEYLASLLWIPGVLVLLWTGNRLIYRTLSRRYPWTGQTYRRFFTQLAASSLYSLLCVNLSYFLLKTLLTGRPPDGQQLMVLNVYGLLFLVPVISVNFGIYFMNQWKGAFIQSEKLKEENLKTRFEALRAHLDPHFMFNSLNVLSSLIARDQAEAQVFLDRFAEVYRYVLRHKDEELVEVGLEREFLEAYLFLFSKRLGQQLRVTVEVPEAVSAYLIPTLSLQMLAENAIKHNKATHASPLQIAVFAREKAWLVVQNTYQPRQAESAPPPGTGLENIRNRYAFFSEQKVEVSCDGKHFTVSIPLIRPDEV
jgi:hypothetical protein